MQIPTAGNSGAMAALEQAAASQQAATDALHLAIQAQSLAAALELQVDLLTAWHHQLRQAINVVAGIAGVALGLAVLAFALLLSS